MDVRAFGVVGKKRRATAGDLRADGICVHPLACRRVELRHNDSVRVRTKHHPDTAVCFHEDAGVNAVEGRGVGFRLCATTRVRLHHLALIRPHRRDERRRRGETDDRINRGPLGDGIINVILAVEERHVGRPIPVARIVAWHGGVDPRWRTGGKDERACRPIPQIGGVFVGNAAAGCEDVVTAAVLDHRGGIVRPPVAKNRHLRVGQRPTCQREDQGQDCSLQVHQVNISLMALSPPASSSTKPISGEAQCVSGAPTCRRLYVSTASDVRADR